MSNEHKYCIGKDDHSWEVGYDKGYRQGRADVIKEIDTIIDFVKSNSFDHSLEFDSFKAVGSSVIINLLEQLKAIE